MPRPKTESPSDEGPGSPIVRRRVVKACQRCRLKKCKCDGATPCLRCKSDDAICAYGKHKKSEKTIFRKGYVQMLERQHSQLIAGLQELYRRTQTGQSWTLPQLELVNHNQPLTHKILESLGVLRAEEWEDDQDTPDGMSSLGFEELQSQCGGGVSFDTAPSSVKANTPVFSQHSSITPHSTAFPDSEIMAKRRAKQLERVSRPLDLPASSTRATAAAPSQAFDRGAFSYTFDAPIATTAAPTISGPYSRNLRLQIPPSTSILMSGNGTQNTHLQNNNNNTTNNKNGNIPLEPPLYHTNNSSDGLADDDEEGLPFGQMGFSSLMFDQPMDQALSLQT